MPSTRRPDEHRELSPEVRENLALDFGNCLRRTDLATASIRLFDGAAKHFLIWVVRERIHLRSVDDNTLRRFRFHECRCPLTEEGLPRHKRCTPQLRRTMHGAEHFVQFLEETGRTDHPQERALGQQLLTSFLANCKSHGFSGRVGGVVTEPLPPVTVGMRIATHPPRRSGHGR